MYIMWLQCNDAQCSQVLHKKSCTAMNHSPRKGLGERRGERIRFPGELYNAFTC